MDWETGADRWLPGAASVLIPISWLQIRSGEFTIQRETGVVNIDGHKALNKIILSSQYLYLEMETGGNHNYYNYSRSVVRK